jgi:hypothetical protein
MSKTRKAVKVGTEEWVEHFNRMMWLRDPELVLLKGHLLIEQMLYHAAAIRLRIREDADVPKMPIGTLIDIAFIGVDPERRKRVLWFNNLRNDLAHEFRPLESAAFRQTVTLFGATAWPSSDAERAGLLKCLTDYVCKIVFRHAQDHQLPPAFPPSRADAEDFMDILEMARDLDREITDIERSLGAGVIPDGYMNVRPVDEQPGPRPGDYPSLHDEGEDDGRAS